METPDRRYARPFTRYVLLAHGLIGLAIAVLLALNLLVDPLWYFGGNKLTGVNYAFNERISKSNLFVEDPESYDCVILGSSRTTLLDARGIEGYRCFNYAVSQATVSDLHAIIRYVRHYSPSIRLVVTGIDGYNFAITDPGLTQAVPPFMVAMQSPPDLMSSYLSLDALDFSWRTLRRVPPNFRFYDREFAVDVVPGAREYHPSNVLDLDEREGSGSFDQFPLGPFTTERAAAYAEIRQAFPEAKLIGYVPPVSAYYISKLRFARTLESYLDAIHVVSGHFDQFLDFSVPSSVTRDPSKTYDGGHYYPEINARLISALEGEPSPMALPVHDLSRELYGRAFASRVDHFIESAGIRLAGASVSGD